MRPAEIEKLIRKLRYKASAETHDRVLGNVLQTLDKSEKIKSAPAEPEIWRITPKYPIIKLAAAAVIIAAAGLAISLWDRPVSRAYAIEQTIEAMRKVNTIHCLMKISNEEQYEVWIEVDPITGEYKNIFMDSPEVTKVATLNGISAYYKNTNEVSYFKLNSHIVYEIHFKPFIKDMADLAKSYSNSKIKIIEGKGEKSFITVTLDKDESTLEWKVDANTKLPISMNLLSKEVLLPTQFNQSISDFSYNVPLPEGIFDFNIPEGAKVKGK